MLKYSFKAIKKKLNPMIAIGLEPELTLSMYGKEYMIIGYDGKCSFQRCGINDGSGEVYYNTLDELYNSITVDNILLKRDWGDIIGFDCDDYEWEHGV
ncbi:MAG: hypothetical protein FWB80_07900 [Defluviitaleaceae bacterium]|nr:hypothetical protein [Defluviitaleaceae bacterium]